VISPFQNIDWTNVHVVGADITGGSLTHSLRFGYVNFNNRIESKELDESPLDLVYRGGLRRRVYWLKGGSQCST